MRHIGVTMTRFAMVAALLSALMITMATAQQSPQTTPAIPTMVSTEQLRLDFIANELAAERRYGGGRQLVTFGEMRSLRRERDGSVVVQFTGVEAYLQPNMSIEAATYRQGQQLQLVCVLGPREFWVSLRECRSPNMDGSATVQVKPEPPPISASAIPMMISAAQYHADYNANPLAADMRYKGRSLAIFGTVRLVGRDTEGHAYVSLHADRNNFADVDAILIPEMPGEAATYRPGQQVQLICIGGVRINEAGSIGLNECRSP